MSSTKITRHDLDESVFETVEQEISDLKSTNESFVSSKQDKHSTATIVLPVASWNNNSQTVTCTGVTVDNTIIVTPTPDSLEIYSSAQVKCITQASNSLTFTCSEMPESDVQVNIIILGV